MEAAIGIATGMTTGAAVGGVVGMVKVGGMMAGIMPTVAAAGATATEVMRTAMLIRDIEGATPVTTVIRMRAADSAAVTAIMGTPAAAITAEAAITVEAAFMAEAAFMVEADSTVVDTAKPPSEMQGLAASCQLPAFFFSGEES